MVTFNPIHREYISPANLETVAQTYNTLEQGHQKAVQTASDLRLAISKLDLNEKESAFRQGLYNEIQSTIQENTLYGNSYAALDDLIAKSGEIFSRPDLKGRLDAQAAYKKYMAEIDNAKIPESYKNHYRKKNYYRYEDKYDENNNVIEGDAWQPQERFVDSIDAFARMQSALQIAAKEAGGSEAINENGEWLVKKGTRYEKLPAEKIKAAILASFASTPGMYDSLHQDWNITVNEAYEEKLKENKGQPFIDTNMTDSNGNKLNERKFIDKMIDDFINASAYNHTWTTTDYQAIPRHIQSSRAAAANSTYDNNINNLGLNLIGTVDSSIDTYNNSRLNNAKAHETFRNVLNKQGIFKNVSYPGLLKFVQDNTDAEIKGPNTLLNTFFNMKATNGTNTYGDYYSNEEKNIIRNAALEIYRESNNQRAIKSNLPSNLKDGFGFQASIDSGIFKVGNSKYDDKIIKIKNKLYSDGKDLEFTLDDNLYTNLCKLYDDGLPSELKIRDIEGKKVITVPVDYTNGLPEFAYKLITANDNTTSYWQPINWITGLTQGRKVNLFSLNKLDNYEQEVSQANNYMLNIGNETKIRTTVSPESDIRRLANIYSNGLDEANKAIDYIAKNSPIRTNVYSMIATSQTQAAYFSQPEYLVDWNEAKSKIEFAEKKLDAAFATSGFSAGMIYEIEDYGDKNYLKFTPTSEANTMQALINYMYTNHKDDVKRQYGSFNGVIDKRIGRLSSPDGFYLTFTVPNTKDSNNKLNEIEGAKKLAGKTIKLYVSGTIDEGTGITIGSSNYQQARNSLTASKNLNGEIHAIIPFNKYLQSSSTNSLGGGQYNINFLGTSAIVNEDVALQFNTDLIDINTIKGKCHGVKNVQTLELLEDNFQPIFNRMGIIFRCGSEQAKSKILQYLLDDTVE